MSSQNLILRVQQLLLASDEERKSFNEAVEQALRERFKGPNQFDELIFTTVQLFSAANKSLAKLIRDTTTNLPEPRQGEFYYASIPQIIFIEANGGTVVRKDAATLGEVREWDRWALQVHSVQRLRFERLTKELETVNDLDDNIPWKDARQILTNRCKQLKEEVS